MHLGKGLNTVQIFKGHLRREGIIPELIIYTVLDISIELKSKQKMDNNNVKIAIGADRRR